MSEGVWTNCLLQTNGFGQCINDMEDSDSRYIFPPFADKNIVLVALFDRNLISVNKVKLKFSNGSRRDRDQTLFASFPINFDEAFF